MIAKDKRYWFYISPAVYVHRNRENTLLYHTQTGAHMEVCNTLCNELIDAVESKDWLGVIELDPKYFDTPQCLDFVEAMIDRKMAAVVEIDETKPRPIVFRPILNLQTDIDKLRADHEAFIGQNVLQYVNQLYVYLNNECATGCAECSSFCLQTLYCRSNNEQTEALPPKAIESLLLAAQHSAVGTINFLGGDLSRYPYHKELVELLSRYEFTYRFWFDYRHADAMCQWITEETPYKTEILIPPSFDHQVAERCAAVYAAKEDTAFRFLITNEAQYAEVAVLVERNALKNVRVLPFFNEDNLDFFRQNVFMDQESVLAHRPTQRTLFCNQKLNSNYFGVLHILADGSVEANPHKGVVGNIHHAGLIPIAYNELLQGTSWRDVRSAAPCSSCLYQYVCPPPSSYEYALNRPNLCHITQ